MFLLVGAALVACQPAAEKTEESSYKLWVVKPENRTLKSEYTASLAGKSISAYKSAKLLIFLSTNKLEAKTIVSIQKFLLP